MRLAHLSALPMLALALALAACESEAEREADATEDRIEQQADASAAAAGGAIAALGLTETQLLDADLVAEVGAVGGDARGLSAAYPAGMPPPSPEGVRGG